MEELVRVDDEGGLVATAELSGFLTTERRPSPEEVNVFRLDGEKWTVRFEGVTRYLDDDTGLPYLKVLLENPGREYPPAILAIEAGEGVEPEGQLREDSLDPAGLESAGPVLDKQARRECRKRLRDIEVELAEAQSRHDLGRAETLRAEKKQVEEALLSAEGLRGRPRYVSDPRKQARDRVTAAIARSRRKIAKAHPSMAAHLQAALQRGKLWSYRTENPVYWQF
jgi:hypothetical protein